MAILRAGPFASSTDSFLDEPSPPSFATRPVNCALVDWTNDGWRAVERKRENGGTPVYSYITSPTSSSSFSGTTSINSVSFSFLYQAAIATSITFNYSATSTGFGSDAIAVASVDGTTVLFDRDQGTGPSSTVSVSGSAIIDMPIAIRPILVSVGASASLEGSGSLSIAP